MEQRTGFAISVAYYVPESSYGDAIGDFEAAQFPVSLERRNPEVFAALQYLMPTAVVVYLLKPYFEKFLTKMAEDHYDWCKAAVKKLWSNFVSNDRSFRSQLVGTRGKLFENDLALELSFVAKTADHQCFHLLFPHSISASEFQTAIVAFYSLMSRHDRDRQKSVLIRSASGGHKAHHQRVLTWASDPGRLVEVEVLESSLQKRLVITEIPSPNN
jgi:hypothetical protein